MSLTETEQLSSSDVSAPKATSTPYSCPLHTQKTSRIISHREKQTFSEEMRDSGFSSTSGIQAWAIRMKTHRQTSLVTTHKRQAGSVTVSTTSTASCASSSLAGCSNAEQFTVYHCEAFPKRRHRTYQPFNAFCKVSKQLTRCWCPPEFITTRFSYVRKKKKNGLSKFHSTRENYCNFPSAE